MKHHAPRVNSASSGHSGPTMDQLAGRVLRKGVQRLNNPMVAAIVEEMGPEIDELLAEHLGDQEIDLTRISAGLDRTGRILARVAERNARQGAD